MSARYRKQGAEAPEPPRGGSQENKEEKELKPITALNYPSKEVMANPTSSSYFIMIVPARSAVQAKMWLFSNYKIQIKQTVKYNERGGYFFGSLVPLSFKQVFGEPMIREDCCIIPSSKNYALLDAPYGRFLFPDQEGCNPWPKAGVWHGGRKTSLPIEGELEMEVPMRSCVRPCVGEDQKAHRVVKHPIL